MKIPKNVKDAINNMFLCKNMQEHLACYQRNKSELKDCTFIVFSENEGTKLPDPLRTNYNSDFAVVNIGCADCYYAVNEQIFQEMLVTGRSNYYIDLCVELDTQAMSYLKNIFDENGQFQNNNDKKSLINYLNIPGVDYSCIPYLVENAAKRGKIKQDDCKSNIKSFMYLKNFDYSGFLENGTSQYKKRNEDIQLEADELYNSMFSEEFSCCFRNVFEMQHAAYILLVKASCIEFRQPHKTAQIKMMELFDFVNMELGFIADRELEVCFRYFDHDDRTKKFFKGVQKNSKKILENLNGMAWDLIQVRMIERGFALKPVESVRYAIHMLLTYDNGLKEILQINPMEQIALYKGVPIPKLKHSWYNEIQGAYEKIFLDKNVRLRRQTFNAFNYEKIKIAVENELLRFCNG